MQVKKKSKAKSKLKKWRFPLWGIASLILAGFLLAQFILLPSASNLKKDADNPFKLTTTTLQPSALPQKITPKPTKSYTIHSGYQLKVPILMYHYIGYNPDPADKARYILATNPDNFKQQMKYLSDQSYQTISLDTLYAALKKQTTLPSKPIILTFDDGYEDFYTNAYPLLKKYNLKSTLYVIVNAVDKPGYITLGTFRSRSIPPALIYPGLSKYASFNSRI